MNNQSQSGGGLTARGQLLTDVLCGYEMTDVSETALRVLCRDLSASTPPRYLRAHRDPRRGGWRVALVGTPDLSYRRDEI